MNDETYEAIVQDLHATLIDRVKEIEDMGKDQHLSNVYLVSKFDKGDFMKWASRRDTAYLESLVAAQLPVRAKTKLTNPKGSPSDLLSAYNQVTDKKLLAAIETLEERRRGLVQAV
jgi:hypothetical protein